jgi:hypothetical protein
MREDRRMMDAELPNHLLYMLVFGSVLLGAVVALIIEFGTRGGRRRRGMVVWSVLAGLVGAVFFVLNVANVVTESMGTGAG